MKKIVLSIFALGLAVLTPASVFAATPQISIPIETIKYGPVGSLHVLAQEDVQEDYVGLECSVSAVAENQGSVHPNNDIIVQSGDESVTLADVEREANGLTTAEGKLTAGENLTVYLKLGVDKIFSGGMTVEIHCEKPEPKKIEVCRDNAVITINEDDRLATDTDAPCPAGIEVCRDGSVITIGEDTKLDTDTDAPCPVEEPKKIEVCRDGKIISINEDDKLTTDTVTCPKVLGVATELPKTGASSTALLTVAAGIFGTAAHAVVTRKKNQ